jgi:hypothetical protein
MANLTVEFWKACPEVAGLFGALANVDSWNCGSLLSRLRCPSLILRSHLKRLDPNLVGCHGETVADSPSILLGTAVSALL